MITLLLSQLVKIARAASERQRDYMIPTIVIGIVAIIAIVSIWNYHLNTYWGEGVDGAISGTVGALMVAVVAWFLAMGMLRGAGAQHVVHTEKTAIRAMTNSSGIEGAFFLGSGYVKDELTYTYIAQESDGGFKLDSVRADNAKVYEDAAPGTGYIEWDYMGPTSNLWSFFDQTEMQAPTAQIHVPSGSVQAPAYSVNVTK